MNFEPLDPDLLHDEIEAEIAKAAGKTHYLALILPPEQLSALVRLREGGLDWKQIDAFWKRKGWRGSENTLRKIYREATRGQGDVD